MKVVYTEGLMGAKYDVPKNELQVMNHLDITVEVHAGMGDRFKIVGFDVEPKSINWGDNPCDLKMDVSNQKMLYEYESEGKPDKITYTYSVRIK